jgi:hypothetical protein
VFVSQELFIVEQVCMGAALVEFCRQLNIDVNVNAIKQLAICSEEPMMLFIFQRPKRYQPMSIYL